MAATQTSLLFLSVDWASSAIGRDAFPMLTLRITPAWLSYQAIAFIMLLSWALWYGRSLMAMAAARARNDPKQRPPMVPHHIPLIGQGLSAAWDMPELLKSIVAEYKGIPVCLRLGFLDINFIFQARDIKALFSQSRVMNNSIYRDFAVSTMFGMPDAARRRIAADDTGLLPTPHPNSNTKPEDRILYLTHHTMSKYISGPRLKLLATRYTEKFCQSLQNLEIRDEWTRIPSLYQFLQHHIFSSAVKSIFGNALLELNPNLIDDFWAFDDAISDLAKGYPRWMIPGAYAARDRCLAAVTKWHEVVRSTPYVSDSDDEEAWDPLHGDGIMRIRRNYQSKCKEMDVAAQASEDLGFIWGANANSTHIAFWLINCLLHNPLYLLRAQQAIAEVSQPAADLASRRFEYDGPTLTASPYLTSLYTEAVRMYSASLILRNVTRSDVQPDSFTIPKGSIVGLDSYLSHHDETKWNCGTKTEPHPIEEFWDRRHLIIDENGQDVFSIEKQSGVFVPYGGGHNMCPGRHFAKQEILLAMAIVISEFDIEMVQSNAGIDWRSYGTGSLIPMGETECRLRRRQQ